MSTVNEDWKEIRPIIGNFISKLDGLTKGCSDIDSLLEKTEKKGYDKGFSDARADFCKTCAMKEYYLKCNGDYSVIERFVKLSNDNKFIIRNLIDKLAKMEGII